MNRAFLKVVFSEMVKVATFPFRMMKIKNNRILFTGLTGGNGYDYSCNPKYLYEYMKENFPGQFEYVWAVSDKEKYGFLEEEGVKLVKHFTVSSFPMLLTSKVIVTNGSYAPWFPFRKKQYVINTWHGGGAYKKVENDMPNADWATRKRAEFCANNIDLFLASCKTQEDNMIRKTFLYKGEVLRAGTPRNDKLFNGDIKEMAEKVRKQYQIPENGKIVLYAPTYRITSIPVELDAAKLTEALNESVKENSEWFFISRYHRYQNDSMKICVTGNNVIDAFDYPDMQELLAAADILITDYSSSVWDYALLRRPCYLYVPDKDEYIEKTGFYVGLDEWPFLQAKNMEELITIVAGTGTVTKCSQGQAPVEEHLKALGSYETGECCKKVVEMISNVCKTA